jgi:glycine/D-amino acid oxidase-like deaminating enzyme
MTTIEEPGKILPVRDRYDVMVCGGGPAGFAAALSAARAGARTCLIEHQGFLGGIWTAGLLSFILDARDKPGLIAEVRRRLRERGAIREARDLYDAEEMKLLLEDMCREAGVIVRLYTRLASVLTRERHIRHVILEAKEGRFALEARNFVDATGDGDLGALAGCGFEIGRSGDGLTQPMTLMALVSGVPEHVRNSPFASAMGGSCISKDEFYQALARAGFAPSYTKPSLFPLPNGLCCLMANHEYERSGLKSEDLTAASMNARREIHRVVNAMRRIAPEWNGVRLVATAPHIGVREGRRLNGLYRLNLEDLQNGARFDDGIARATFPIDVHSIRRSDGGGYSSDGAVKQAEPYDIPLRCLIAADVDNLAMAGRCISGDFHAHASYRVTGNAVATGEAAGVVTALASQRNTRPADIPARDVLKILGPRDPEGSSSR